MTSPTETPSATVTTAPAKPRGRTSRKSGDPQADRTVRDAAAAKDAAVLNGVGTDKPAAPAKPRTPRPTPPVTKATPKKPAAKTTKTPAAKKPAPKTAKAPAAPKPDTRASKQDLARMVVQAMADAVDAAYATNDPTAYSFVASMDEAEARQTVANQTHHLPTGKTEEGARWWPTNLPKPQRSDWA